MSDLCTLYHLGLISAFRIENCAFACDAEPIERDYSRSRTIKLLTMCWFSGMALVRTKFLAMKQLVCQSYLLRALECFEFQFKRLHIFGCLINPRHGQSQLKNNVVGIILSR